MMHSIYKNHLKAMLEHSKRFTSNDGRGKKVVIQNLPSRVLITGQLGHEKCNVNWSLHDLT